MAKLVSRFAENAFWLARYVERAENLARIIEINKTYTRDQSGALDWQRIPDLYADLPRFKETHDEVNEQTVLDFYALDRDNPTSIRSAVSSARENARAIRHLISTEMWTQLNIFHNTCRAWTRRDIDLYNVWRLCQRVTLNCQAFEGIAEGTFLRGEAWTFYQLGKHIERADQTTRILDIGYDRLTLAKGDAVGSVYWNALLRSVSGYHAYRHRHPVDSSPDDIARFLLYDREFPRAVALCVDQITERIHELERRHDVRRRQPVEQTRRELEFVLETGLEVTLTSARLHTFLDQLQVALSGVSNALAQTYFH